MKMGIPTNDHGVGEHPMTRRTSKNSETDEKIDKMDHDDADRQNNAGKIDF